MNEYWTNEIATAVPYVAQLEAALGSLPDVETVIDRLDALEDMVNQFAYRFIRPRGKWYQLILTTGGLSALEHAFDSLGWKQPKHVVKDPSPGAIASLERSKHIKPGMALSCRDAIEIKRRKAPGQGICLRYDGHPDFHIDYEGRRWENDDPRRLVEHREAK